MEKPQLQSLHPPSLLAARLVPLLRDLPPAEVFACRSGASRRAARGAHPRPRDRSQVGTPQTPAGSGGCGFTGDKPVAGRAGERRRQSSPRLPPALLPLPPLPPFVRRARASTGAGGRGADRSPRLSASAAALCRGRQRWAAAAPVAKALPGTDTQRETDWQTHAARSGAGSGAAFAAPPLPAPCSAPGSARPLLLEGSQPRARLKRAAGSRLLSPAPSYLS